MPMHLRVISQYAEEEVEEGEIVEEPVRVGAVGPIVWLEAVENDGSVTRLF